MSFLYVDKPTATYVFKGYRPEQVQSLMTTTCTVYVGNLSFYTTEEQIWELFSKCGEVKKITMGLNSTTHTPCGFCFVEYYTHEEARDCVKWLNNTKLDERVVRVDWDLGVEIENRKFGRGKSGGQVRDDYRTNYDPGRGGYGTQKLAELSTEGKRTREEEEEEEEERKKQRQ